MLLSGNADGADPAAINFSGDGGDDRIERGRPFFRLLLQVASRQTSQQSVRRPGFGNDAAQLEIQDDGLGALGAAIDAEVKAHGLKQGSRAETQRLSRAGKC